MDIVKYIHRGSDDRCFGAILANWCTTNMNQGENLIYLLSKGMSLKDASKSMGLSSKDGEIILSEYQRRFCDDRDNKLYDCLYPTEEFYRWINDLKGENDVFFSLNSFYRRKKKASEVRHINAFCMDFDYYKLKRYSNLPPKEFYKKIIKKKLKFDPTAVIDSGRGIYIIYAFHHCSYHMDRLYHAVMNHYLKIFEKYGMDSKALNTTQVIRIPGSINSKTGRTVSVIEFNETNYTLQQLATQLPWTLKDVKNHKNNGNKKKREIDWDLSKRRPYYDAYYKDFQTLIRLRNMSHQYNGYRETLLWIAREKATWLGYSIDESVQIAMELNDLFHEPLPKEAVEKQCRPSSNRSCCNIDTIIGRLSISAQEQRHMKVLKHRALKKASYANRKRKMPLLNRTKKQQEILERRTRVCELKNVKHLSNARIAEILGVHRSTITKDLRYIQLHPSQFIRELKSYMDAIEDALVTKEFRRKTIYQVQQRLAKWLKIAYTALDYLVRLRAVAKN